MSEQDAIDKWKNDFKGYVNALNIPRDDYNGIMEYIDEVPSAEPEPREVVPHRNYQYLSDYWCQCGWHLGKKGDVKYCPDCGRKVIWDGSD